MTIPFRMLVSCSMEKHNLHEMTNAIAIENKHRDTAGEQPKRHAEAENNAEQGDIQNLKVHFVGIVSGAQKEADLDGKKDKRIEAEQQKYAHGKLPANYEN